MYVAVKGGEAAIEATEEAILNALLAAGEMSGWDARQGAPAHYPGLRL